MKRYLVLATNLFFGLPISLLVVMYAVINEIDGYLQIRFFVSYMFTNKHYNVEIEKLEMINQSTKYRNKIYKYAVRLLNKRNNYTYSEPQED